MYRNRKCIKKRVFFLSPSLFSFLGFWNPFSVLFNTRKRISSPVPGFSVVNHPQPSLSLMPGSPYPPYFKCMYCSSKNIRLQLAFGVSSKYILYSGCRSIEANYLKIYYKFYFNKIQFWENHSTFLLFTAVLIVSIPPYSAINPIHSLSTYLFTRCR